MSGHDSRAGFALVAVLWMIALLTALALAVSLMFRGFAGLVATSRDAAKADALLAGGIEYAADRPHSGRRATFSDDTCLLLGSGAVRFALSDDGGRININKAPAALLASLFQTSGASGGEAHAIAQAIVAWRVRNGADPLKIAQIGSASGDDEQVFTDLRQLARVPGMRADYLAAIMPLATVFGDGRINALTAPASVIGAVPGVSPAMRDALLAARQRGPGAVQSLVPMLTNAQDYLKWRGTTIALAELTATLPDGYAKMLGLSSLCWPGDERPYRILAWTPMPLASE